MEIAKRHLNWTMGIALLSVFLIIPLAYFEPVVYLILYAIWGVVVLIIGGWVLKQKGRSLATLLWVFLISILVFFVIIAMENKRSKKKVEG